MIDCIKLCQDMKKYNKPVPKTLVKKGTLSIHTVESTPIVWKKELYCFEWVRPINGSGIGHYRFINRKTHEITPAFAFDHTFGSPYAENGTMYVVGVKSERGKASEGTSDELTMYWSKDLKNWQEKVALKLKGWEFYNTSICKGANGKYIMAIEIGAPKEIAGNIFTIVFAQSDNLLDWELLDPYKHVYTKERYSACPVIRYEGGYYYMIYLEAMPLNRYVPYIIRSNDLLSWECGFRNPVMFYDDKEDKKIHPDAHFSSEQIDWINNSLDINNSDVDLCEYQGKTVIMYSWGNQLGREFLAEAEFDGSMQEFFESFF